MKKIITRVVIIFAMIFICLSLDTNTSAELKKVVDGAVLFSSEEVSTLETSIKDISSRYDMDIVIVTTTNMNGKSSKEYADDFFDYEGYGYGNDKSGIILLYNMFDREIYISTSGEGERYFTDSRIESILDDIYNYLPDGEYFEGGKAFLNSTEKYLDKGIPSNQYTVDEDGNIILSNEDIMKRVLISVGIALAISAVICGIVVSQYKKPASFAEETYVDRNSINFTRRSDRFITTHTTSRKIPKNNGNSGGGSGRTTTHTSSSGNSHGGGGRSF